MRRVFLSLAIGCINAGAWAATPARLDNPQGHVSVTVDRQGAEVRGGSSGDVRFRPDALVRDGHALSLRPARAAQAGPRITQSLGHGVSAWYVNTPFGIEQGFVLSRPAQGQVGIRMTLGGTLLPYRRGSGLGFSGLKRSRDVLAYSRFIAYDADHRRLPAHLVLEGRRVTLWADTHGARYPVTFDPLLSSTPEILTTPEAIEPYQIAASSDGNVIIVGAPGSHTSSGVAYALRRTSGAWSAGTALAYPVSGSVNYFGASVGISADGQTAVVGAPALTTAVSRVFIYTHGSSGWTLAATLATAGIPTSTISSPSFGQAVAISADGHILLVGAPRAAVAPWGGDAYVYTRSGSTWTGPVALQVPTDTTVMRLGNNVALSSDGKTALVTAGRLSDFQALYYVYNYNGSSWSAPVPLTIPSGATTFGPVDQDVAMSGDGTVILVRALTSLYQGGTLYSYVLSSGTWSAPQVVGTTTFWYSYTHSLALSPDGNKAVVGVPNGSTGGEVDLYARSGTTWTGPAVLSTTAHYDPSDLGGAVALSADGRTAFGGASGTTPIFVTSSPIDMAFGVTPSPTGTVAPASQVTLAFDVTDSDPDLDATDLTLDEVLPAGASYVSSNGDSGVCNYTSATNSVTCTLASLAHPSGTWQPAITIQVPPAAGTVTNVAALSADQVLDGAADLHTSITVQAAGGGSSSGGSSGGSSSSGGSTGGGSGNTGSSGGGTFDLLTLVALFALARQRRIPVMER